MTKITELILDEGEDLYGVDAISLVEYPAIEQNFVFLSQEKNKYVFAKEDDEKKLLVGPALIPNKQIYRMDQETGEEYYAHFSKETIRRVSELYLQKNNHHNYTYEHENKVGGLSLFESWIVDFPDMDKSRAYGFEPKEAPPSGNIASFKDVTLISVRRFCLGLPVTTTGSGSKRSTHQDLRASPRPSPAPDRPQ